MSKNGALAVTKPDTGYLGLKNQVVGGIWKSLDMPTREGFEYCKQSLVVGTQKTRILIDMWIVKVLVRITLEIGPEVISVTF